MIITLTGTNRFALMQALNKLTTDFVAKYGDFAIEKIDTEESEFEKITEAMLASPFLASKRLVVLRAPSFHKLFVEDFEKLIRRVPDETTLVIYEPKLDKRLAYYKTLQKKTDFREFNQLAEPELKKWLVNYSKSLGGSISQSDGEYLINRLGPNQQLLASEAAKLINYQPTITKETIDLLTEPTPQSTVFELLDAALNGQTAQALKIYDEQRQQNVEPLAIMGMLAWQLHILALVKSAANRSASQIASEAKLNPFVVRKTMSLAKNLDIKQVKQLVADALKLDIRLKSQTVDADEAIKNYFLKLGS